MKLFRRRYTPVDPHLAQAITEREELREAADLLARDLAQARAERDEARRERDTMREVAAANKRHTAYLAVELTKTDDELQRTIGERDKLTELASLGCPRPCCTGRPTP